MFKDKHYYIAKAKYYAGVTLFAIGFALFMVAMFALA